MNTKRALSAFAVTAAMVLGMAITMPSCPGQQALQQQVDSLTTSNADMTKKLQAVDSQVKRMDGEMGQMKLLLSQMTNVISAQKNALEQLDGAIKEIQSKMAPKGKASKTAAKKKK